jgi:hypothetical protein
MLVISLRERATTVEALHYRATDGRLGTLLRLDRLLFGARLLSQFMHQLGSLHH